MAALIQEHKQSNDKLHLPVAIDNGSKVIKMHWCDRLEAIVDSFSERIRMGRVAGPCDLKSSAITSKYLQENYPRLISHLGNLLIIYKVQDNMILCKLATSLLNNYPLVSYMRLAQIIAPSIPSHCSAIRDVLGLAMFESIDNDYAPQKPDHHHDYPYSKATPKGPSSGYPYSQPTPKGKPDQQDTKDNDDQKDNDASVNHYRLKPRPKATPITHPYSQATPDKKDNDDVKLSYDELKDKIKSYEAEIKKLEYQLLKNETQLGDISQITITELNRDPAHVYAVEFSNNFIDDETMRCLGYKSSRVTRNTFKFLCTNLNYFGVCSFKALIDKMHSNSILENTIKRYSINIRMEMKTILECRQRNISAPSFRNWKFAAPAFIFQKRRFRGEMIQLYSAERGAAEYLLREHIRKLAPMHASLQLDDIISWKFIQGERSNLIKITTMVDINVMVDYHINWMALVKLGFFDVEIGNFELWNSDLSQSLQSLGRVGAKKQHY